MVRLNLLPSKVRAAELLRLVAFAGIVVYGLAIAMLAWRMAVAHQQLEVVNAKIAKVETDLRPLQAIADEVKKLTDEKSEQDVKKAKLSELSKHQAYLVRVLDLVPDLMQGGQVWLNALETQAAKAADKGGLRVSLDGRAQSIEAWADFYANLEAQNLVADLKIDTAPAALIENSRRLVQFKVSFTLKDAQ